MTTADDLRKLKSLRHYADDEIEVLASVAPSREFEAGALLCKEGAPGHSCFLITSGEVEVSTAHRDGERVIAKLSVGAFVGQIALVDRRPRSATVRALTQTVVRELSREVFERLLAASSPLALRFQTQIAVAAIRQLRAATDRLVRVTDATPPRPSASKPPPAPDSRVLAHIKAASNEWGLSLEELDAVEVVTPEGIGARGPTRTPR